MVKMWILCFVKETIYNGITFIIVSRFPGWIFEKLYLDVSGGSNVSKTSQEVFVTSNRSDTSVVNPCFYDLNLSWNTPSCNDWESNKQPSSHRPLDHCVCLISIIHICISNLLWKTTNRMGVIRLVTISNFSEWIETLKMQITARETVFAGI